MNTFYTEYNRIPLAYLITFTCYGTWIHGKKAISVDKHHNNYGTAYITPSSARAQSALKRQKENIYILDSFTQRVVLDTILETCSFREWLLYAAHIRTNHIHLVINAHDLPEKMLSAIKANATKKLNETQITDKRTKYWSQHGSTRYLWREQDVMNAIDYVVNQQGRPMAVFENIHL